MSSFDLADIKRRMQGAIASLKHELGGLRTGRASAALLDCLNYGLPTIANANGSAAEVPADAVRLIPDAFTDADQHLGGTDDKGFFIGGRYGFARNAYLQRRDFQVHGERQDVDQEELELQQSAQDDGDTSTPATPPQKPQSPR